MANVLAMFGLVLLQACLAAASDGSHPLQMEEYILEHIWGRCASSPLTPDGIGCYLAGGATCSDHPSEGPIDADVEIVLGDLPASAPGQPVSLQFWAAYESTHEYDPLMGPVGVSLYNRSQHAFPKYYENEFNGGSVQVNESGYATVRVRSPATYVHWIGDTHRLVPVHLYLRVCKDSNVILHPDFVVFDEPERGVWVHTLSQDTGIDVVDARHYVPHAPESGVVYNVPPPWAWLKPSATPAPAEQSDDSGQTPAESQDDSSDDSVAGVPLEIGSAKESLELNALKYSPVYRCFLGNQYYSHYSEGCVDQCDEGQAVSHGQCVRAEALVETVSFWTKWRLDVQCHELCGKAAANETLHRIRLQAGGLLDVPFQEIEVAMVWEPGAGRRLSAAARGLVLQVTAHTRRFLVDEGKPLLDTLIVDSASAAALLQLQVLSIEDISEEGQIAADADVSASSGSDPYETAYEFVMPGSGFEDRDEPEAIKAKSSVPVGVIAGIAVGVVLVGAACGSALFVYHQRMKRREGLAEGAYVGRPVEGVYVDEKKGADKVDAVPEVPATEIGQPAAEMEAGVL